MSKGFLFFFVCFFGNFLIFIGVLKLSLNFTTTCALSNKTVTEANCLFFFVFMGYFFFFYYFKQNTGQ